MRAALRIMEVREAYAAEDFEWDMCQKVALKDLKEGNIKLMRDAAVASLTAAAAEHPEEGQL